MGYNSCLFWVVPLTFVSLLSGSYGKLPDDLHKCKINDQECVTSGAQKVIQKYYRGNEPMGLKSLDPLRIDSIKLTETTDEKKSVNINLFFKNLNVYGISKGKVNHLKFLNHSSSRSFEIDFSAQFPQIELIGDYTINGKILLLGIVGSGKCNITGENMVLRVVLHGNFMQHNGKDYFFLKRIVSADSDLSHAYINLENLFNGNKLLGEGMNKFLNENWAELWKELRPAFIEAFGNVGMDIANAVFQRNTVNKLFSD